MPASPTGGHSPKARSVVGAILLRQNVRTLAGVNAMNRRLARIGVFCGAALLGASLCSRRWRGERDSTVGGRVTVELITSEAQFRNTLRWRRPVSPWLSPAASSSPRSVSRQHTFGAKTTRREDAASSSIPMPGPWDSALRFGNGFRAELLRQTDADTTPVNSPGPLSASAGSSDGDDHLSTTTTSPGQFHSPGKTSPTSATMISTISSPTANQQRLGR